MSYFKDGFSHTGTEFVTTSLHEQSSRALGLSSNVVKMTDYLRE